MKPFLIRAMVGFYSILLMLMGYSRPISIRLSSLIFQGCISFVDYDLSDALNLEYILVLPS